MWRDLQTQWCAGMGGLIGLDYAGVRAHMDEIGLEGETRRDVYAGVRAAERATLEAHAERDAAEQ